MLCVQKEITLKVVMFQYKTPEVLYAHNPMISGLCWRFSCEIGSEYNIFWQCSHIQLFWASVMFIHKVLKMPVPLAPVLWLPQALYNIMLIHVNCSQKRHSYKLLSKDQPSQSQLLNIADIRGMEYLTAVTGDTLTQFSTIWDAWD